MVVVVSDPPPPPPQKPDLEIFKTGEATTSKGPHGGYVFNIGVRNLGPSLTGPQTITVTDTVPAGLTFTAVTAIGWTCTPVAPIAGGGTLTCTYTGSFPVASNQLLGSITITAMGGNGPYENCATLSAPSDTNTNKENDRSCVTVKKEPLGELIVEKKVVYSGPFVMPSLTYPVTVTCGSMVANFNLVPNVPQSVGNVPMNTPCNLVETMPPPPNVCPGTQTPTWAPPVVTPSNPFTLTGVTLSVTVTNALECKPAKDGDKLGTLTVTKDVRNNIQGTSTAGLSFAISVSCQVGLSPAMVSNFNLFDQGSQTIGGIASGSLCTITETLPAAPGTCAIKGQVPTWTMSTVPAGPIPVSGPGAKVTVFNSLDCKEGGGGGGEGGSLLLRKAHKNDTSAMIDGWSYQVAITCVSGGSPATTTNVTLVHNSPQTVTGLPLGSTCTAVETQPSPPTTGCQEGSVPAWDPPVYTPASVTISGKTAIMSIQNVLKCVASGQKIKDVPPVLPPPATCDSRTTLRKGGECACRFPNMTRASASACACAPGSRFVPGKGCIKSPECRAPLTLNSAGTACVCPTGQVRRGNACVRPIECRAPAKANSAGNACVCPPRMQLRGNTCVPREEQGPRVSPSDVIRVVPGLIGPGGGGGSRGGGGGGGAVDGPRGR